MQNPYKFQNPTAGEIKAILERARTVAVLGLSEDPDRPSYSVAMYLQTAGYRIVPIRPGSDRILGEKVYSSLSDVPFPIDIVDIFRRPSAVSAHVSEAMAMKVPAVWLQEGVIDDRAAERAKAAGLFVAMDRCMLKEHRRAGLPSRPPPHR
jgi:predicted CoA-binding protein